MVPDLPTRIDLHGLRCPTLARRIRKALGRSKAHDLLEFVCTDPLAAIDVPRLVTMLGDELVAFHRDADAMSFIVRCSARPLGDA